MTASVCRVIGTGQNGICVLAAIVISAAPAMIVNAVRTGDINRLSIGPAVGWVMLSLLNVKL
jgi:hypothetical protein